MAEVVSTSPHESVKTALVRLFTVGLSVTGMPRGRALLPAGFWDRPPLPGAQIGDDETFEQYPSHSLVIEGDGPGVEMRNGCGLYDVAVEILLVTPQDMDEDEREQQVANVQAFISQKLHEDDPDPSAESVLAFRLNKICEHDDLPCVVWDMTPEATVKMEGGKDMDGRDVRSWKVSLRASAKTEIAA